MPGYEDLTPNQLMTIVWLLWSAILIFAVSHLVGRFFIYRASRFIYLKIEKDIVKNIENEIFNRKPFVVKIKDWWDARKKRKEEKPFG